MDYSRRSYKNQGFSQIKDRNSKTNSASGSDNNDKQNATEWQRLANTITITDDNRDNNCNSDRKSDRDCSEVVHSVNDGDATNPVLVPGRETDNESNSKSNRDRDSYTLRSDFKSDRDSGRDSNNVNDSENNSVNNSDVTNSASVSSGGKTRPRD